MKKIRVFLALIGVLYAFSLKHTVIAQEAMDPDYPPILPMKDRAVLEDKWLEERLNTVAPMVMRKNGIDMWVLIAREYNEDPVMQTMLPATWFAARRRTILVFFDKGDAGVERFAVSRYAVRGIEGQEFFPAKWSPEAEPDQWKRLADLITERNPKKIGVNVSEVFGLADGISHSQYEGFMSALPDKYKARVVGHAPLAIGWLETRTEAEMARYGEIVQIAHAIISEGLSEKVITSGTTRASDVSWWYRDKINSLGLETWFHPSVSIQRAERSKERQSFPELFSGQNADIIRKGDLIHVDFGIKYLGLNTDTQHHAYILRDGENDVPAGLKRALKAGNRLQDILTESYAVGKPGDDALKETREQAIKEGLKPTVYTHPIGFHGHAAGATIGLWDQQGGVKGRGDYPIEANTAWSIELSIQMDLPEWDGQEVRILLEEDGFYDGETFRYINGRQDRFHLVPRPK
jgi:hypothetical protein